MRLLSLLMGTMVAASTIAAPETMLVYIGTYTGGNSQGIYTYELNLKNGSLRQTGLAARTENPSFLAIHPNRHFLYAVNEIDSFHGKKAGSITGFAIEPATGRLRRINDTTTGGPGPCFVSVDHSGRFVLAANYGGGSVCVAPVNERGELGEPTAFVQHTGSSVDKERQNEPHAHSINVDPKNRFAIAADLGLDKLLIYRFDQEKGTLNPNLPPFGVVRPGSGPRHFMFHPNGRNFYVINEMGSTVTAFDWNSEQGSLKQIQTITTLPNGPEKGNSGAELQVHPSGKFVYGSNRGNNSIAVFSVQGDGTLKHVENESTRGKTPRNFGIDPSGRFLIAANQDSDTLAVFRIRQETGALDPVGEPVAAPKPVCVKFYERR